MKTVKTHPTPAGTGLLLSVLVFFFVLLHGGEEVFADGSQEFNRHARTHINVKSEASHSLSLYPDCQLF